MSGRLRTLVARFHSQRPRGTARNLFWGCGVVAGGLILCHALGLPYHRTDGHSVGNHAGWSAQELEKRIEEASRWVFDEETLTAEQKSEVERGLQQLAREIARVEAQREELFQQAASILEGDVIDGEEWRRIQGESLRLSAQATQLGLDAVFEISELLTPEQRKNLAGHWRERR